MSEVMVALGKFMMLCFTGLCVFMVLVIFIVHASENYDAFWLALPIGIGILISWCWTAGWALDKWSSPGGE
jgi:hypothetical protein